MNIFEYSNYKKFVRSWVKTQPRAGYGQYKRLAEALSTSSVNISQIFKGDRDLTDEQALEVAECIGLLDSETQFFLLLVRHQKASTHKLKQHLRSELEKAKESSKDLAARVDNEIELTENDKAIFYSSWEYSAIRLAFDISSIKTVTDVCRRTGVEFERAKAIVEFLLSKGLLKQLPGGIELGPKIVFLEKDSPLILARQRAWRVKAFQEMEGAHRENFFYTCPYVASKKTLDSIRGKLLKLVEETLEDVKPSESEELFCMNIDWFKANSSSQ